MEKGLNKKTIVTELTRSSHGDLASYLPVGRTALREDPAFFAHLISWNRINGSVRDSKVALPMVTIGGGEVNGEFVENADAHLLSLDPRSMVGALRFARESAIPGLKHRAWDHTVGVVREYLRDREANRGAMERAIAAHRASIKSLFAITHTKPSPWTQRTLFMGDYSLGAPLLTAIRDLSKMPALEAAGTIIEQRIPFLTAKGALGARVKEPALVLALIERMSPTELMTNAKSLESWGMNDVPELRAAFAAALEKAKGSKANVLKTSVAAGKVKSEVVREALKATQEARLSRDIEGDWLVLGDKSGSMHTAIDIARQVAAILARSVKGKVYLVFFDTSPYFHDVTGKTHEEIVALTRHMVAGGGTSIGCGLQMILDRKLSVDGITIVSDGGENSVPLFHETYAKYAKAMDAEPTVYMYETDGEPNVLAARSRAFGFDMQVVQLRGLPIDHYSLPNLVQTMRVARYSLIDEIMSTPLLKKSDVLRHKEAA